MNQNFKWKRFWCSRTGSISLNDGGFLFDPESEYAHYYNRDVVTFEAIQKQPCLILLGEPGVGKTTAIKSEILRLQIEKNEEKKDIYIYKDLNEYGDENRLIQEIFDSQTIHNWMDGKHYLHLFLDSIDECLMNIPNLSPILRNRICDLKGKSSRLTVRFSCRTGNWPEILTNEFCAIWGDKNVGVYELAPLRRKDVAEAVQASGFDPTQFLKAVENKEIQPLAINPLTLIYLIDEFRTNGNFSRSRSQLFFTSCKLLCTEKNPYREFSERTEFVSQSRRLALASRIAAVMIFCNRLIINVNANEVDQDEMTLQLSMLQEGVETTGGYNFTFTQRDLLETVRQTALFSGRGPNRFGFSHQSYAEFLAAKYLSLYQLGIQQIKSLIQIYNDPDQITIPQLKNTTAWLNSILPEMAAETIKTDPQSILYGDIESLEFRFRSELVSSLLIQFEQQKILDSDWGGYIQYQKLKHPDLFTQLKPYIEDKNKHFLVRRVAIDIAKACEITELQNLLADLALDESEELHIRDHAAYALDPIADTKTRLRLKPLALDCLLDDKDDQLKGSALHALWPDHLTAQEIFNSLTPPKRQNFFGSYFYFLTEFPKQLKIEDLPFALRWVKNTGDRKEISKGYGNLSEEGGQISNGYENLTSHILFLAWQHLDVPEILDEYAEAIIPRLKNFLSICPVPKSDVGEQTIQELSDNTRKKLIKAVVRKINSPRNSHLLTLIGSPQILFDDDFGWLIEQEAAENDADRKRIWTEIIYDIYRIDRIDHTELILLAIKSCSILSDKFKQIFEPIPLDSQTAQTLRETYKKHIKWEIERQQKLTEQNKRISPPVYERIKTCLERFENGEPSGWWQMCLEMTLKDTSQYYGDEFNWDLVTQPGWEICDDNLKERIISAGKKYIIENSSATPHWLTTNNYDRPAMAGLKSFILLYGYDKNFLETLSSDIWKKWAAVFVGFPGSIGTSNPVDTFSELLKLAYFNAPQEISDTLLILLDKENTEHGHLFSLKKIKNCLDDKLKKTLFEKAQEPSLKPDCFQDILSFLISSNYFDAQKHAEFLLKNPISEDSDLRAKAAALSLLIYANNAGWDVVWPAVKSNTDFGKEIFLSLSNSLVYSKTSSLPNRIKENNTAELFVWLSKNFPRNEDPEEEGAHLVSSRESLANFRDSLVESLVNIGTDQSISALDYIKNELPELNFLNLSMVKARENLRKKNWSPLLPDDFLLLVNTNNSRIILDSGHLVDALIESLIRLEKQLQGETPSAFYLWDKQTKAKFKPKSENDFSDFVKNHITQDLNRSGIIALREVEIRRRQGKGGNPGERTDLYITGYVPSKQKYVRVIVEVKGCWHKEVRTAMETQLLDRYLNESNCEHGIYLVGWFSCNQWDKRESRKDKLAVNSIEEARTLLDMQAKSLCSDTKTVKAFVLNCALR